MKFASLAALTALVVGHVAASPPNNVLTPSGIPATSPLPLSILSFDTTAIPSSVASALSSLISSESTAVTPPSTPATSSGTATGLTSTPTTSSPSTSVASPTGTSGARRSGDVQLAGVALVLGAVAALVY